MSACARLLQKRFVTITSAKSDRSLRWNGQIKTAQVYLYSLCIDMCAQLINIAWFSWHIHTFARTHIYNVVQKGHPDIKWRWWWRNKRKKNTRFSLFTDPCAFMCFSQALWIEPHQLISTFMLFFMLIHIKRIASLCIHKCACAISFAPSSRIRHVCVCECRCVYRKSAAR